MDRTNQYDGRAGEFERPDGAQLTGLAGRIPFFKKMQIKGFVTSGTRDMRDD
jgi:hypothetical protein